MKTAIFNFFVLQVVVWAFVFSADEKTDTQQVQYASLSDTWLVAYVGDQNSDEIVAHYPTFSKLTLNLNGTYIHLRDDETIEEGSWKINKKKAKLTLFTADGSHDYEIVEMPKTNSESFIIKERHAMADVQADIKYELTRL
jgi:hypothetical protein